MVAALCVWGCLTHASFTDWPEPWAAGLALEGANSVDADTAGTGTRIAALIYICMARRGDRK